MARALPEIPGSAHPHLESSSMRYLTAAGPMMRRRLRPPEIPRPEPTDHVAFADRRHCLADVYVPDDVAPGAPTVLVVHGGGFVFGSRGMSSVVVVVDELVRAGFIVASIDYRLALLVRGTRLPEQAQDVIDAAAWWHDAAEDYGGRPGVDALMGLSAGGALSLFAASEVPIQRYVGIYGAYDLTLLPVRWFTASTLVRSPRRRDHEARSPLHHGAFDAPALLIHGTSDPLAVPEHTRRLAALRGERELPTRVEWVDGAVHGYLQDGAQHPHSRQTLDAILGFLQE